MLQRYSEVTVSVQSNVQCECYTGTLSQQYLRSQCVYTFNGYITWYTKSSVTGFYLFKHSTALYGCAVSEDKLIICLFGVLQ